MRITPVHVCFLLAGIAFAPLAPAQETAKPAEMVKAAAAEQHFYRLTFVVQELGTDSKPTNGRSYVTTANTNSMDWVQLRADSRIPVATNVQKSGAGALLPTQWQFMDIGVRFDTRDVREVGRQLALHIKADVSSLVPSSSQELVQPVTRHNQWDAPVLIPIGKPTPIFTSDALDDKTAMQVVLTATPLP